MDPNAPREYKMSQTSGAAGLLRRQFKEMQTAKDLPGISCGLVNDNVFTWEVMLMISDDCPYYGGMSVDLMSILPVLTRMQEETSDVCSHFPRRTLSLDLNFDSSPPYHSTPTSTRTASSAYRFFTLPKRINMVMKRHRKDGRRSKHPRQF